MTDVSGKGPYRESAVDNPWAKEIHSVKEMLAQKTGWDVNEFEVSVDEVGTTELEQVEERTGISVRHVHRNGYVIKVIRNKFEISGPVWAGVEGAFTQFERMFEYYTQGESRRVFGEPYRVKLYYDVWSLEIGLNKMHRRGYRVEQVREVQDGYVVIYVGIGDVHGK